MWFSPCLRQMYLLQKLTWKAEIWPKWPWYVQKKLLCIRKNWNLHVFSKFQLSRPIFVREIHLTGFWPRNDQILAKINFLLVNPGTAWNTDVCVETHLALLSHLNWIYALFRFIWGHFQPSKMSQTSIFEVSQARPPPKSDLGRKAEIEIYQEIDL